ncbi:hypothetical protein Y032_0806g2443 [Ancylostoma ceylanicum]|uniref:Uncharacterized protein n=1 Tax=Ancylostoma ceylanicum TaxID=53326 RepID=A0A016WDC8_9BILA|nr:hypothetical protein Y032_0806g2443 [Ancylostoma ceylanicum]
MCTINGYIIGSHYQANLGRSLISWMLTWMLRWCSVQTNLVFLASMFFLFYLFIFSRSVMLFVVILGTIPLHMSVLPHVMNII